MRIGLVAGQSGHVRPFARLIQQSHRARVTAATGDDQVVDALAEMTGCRRVSSAEQLAGEVDAVMVVDDRDDGACHAGHAEPALRAGLPTFIDKPLMPELESAQALVKLAREHQAPLMSTSSARYAPALDAFRDSDVTPWQSLFVGGPGEWWFYGVHLAEIAVALLGPGFEVRSAVADSGNVLARLQHRDHASVVLELVPGGAEGFAVAARSERALLTASLVPPFDTWYARLIDDFLTMVDTGTEPIDPAETLDVMRVLDAVERATHDGRRPGSDDDHA